MNNVVVEFLRSIPGARLSDMSVSVTDESHALSTWPFLNKIPVEISISYDILFIISISTDSCQRDVSEMLAPTHVNVMCQRC